MSKGLNRRVLGALSAMVLATAILVLALALIGAKNQNQLAIDASAQLADTALSVKQREIARNLEDYSYREDAYRNIHQDVNYDWIRSSRNLGANIYSSLGYEMAFVITPEMKTIHAMIDGRAQPTDAFQVMPDGLKQLVARSGSQLMPAVGLLRSTEGVLLVAAAAVRSPTLEQNGVEYASPRPTIVFAKKLNASLLSRIGSDYRLNRLRIASEGDKTLGASLQLTSPSGETVAWVTWIPEQPGYTSLRLLLPAIAIAFAIFALFALFTLRYTRRSALELQSSALTISSYADTLRKSEARFRDVAEATSDWIWECDRETQVFYVSSRFTDVTGLAESSAVGRKLEAFFEPDENDEGWQSRAAELAARLAFRDLRCRYADASGVMRVCRLAARPIVDDAGAFTGYRGTATDITHEVEAQARAVYLSLHDTLTGLPNRALFRERLNVAFQNTLEERSRLAVLCLDLDHFKEVNDTLGHAAGDSLLQEVAERLRACVLASDTVARLGGDEFAVIQNGVHQPLEAMALSRRIIAALGQPYFIEGKELHVGVSVGIAFVENDGDAPSVLLKNADIALYRAKQAGRGTAKIFEAHMDLELQARRSLEFDLRHAIARNELELHYQPLIKLGDERIVGVEALVRWRHPERGLVPPINFIPLAEANNLILPIGEWVLRTACRQASAWPDIIVAVNLSPVQFKHHDLVATVRGILAETGLPARRLELEITESVLLHDSAAALEILTELKSAGVRIVMDDFGTGYSSLGYLNSFPFDKIKIDKSFIADLSAAKSNAIVRSVISLGHSLNMVTTAEGVETEEQAQFLREEGCEQVQGFHFGRPIPARDMTDLISGWSRRAAA